jgi:NAD(P)-dependent dehydrogenase (short-subunit alcohol dehydrogenase family)
MRSTFVNGSFNDKVALVTGAAGMGLATARAFAEAGAAVALQISMRMRLAPRQRSWSPPVTRRLPSAAA